MKITIAISLAAIVLSFAACNSNPCVDVDSIDYNAVCNQVYAPVCGCNNQSYLNACDAERNGVQAYTGGECL